MLNVKKKSPTPVIRFQNLRAFDGKMIQTVCFLLGGCVFFRRVATVTLASIRHQDSKFACRFMAGVPKFYKRGCARLLLEAKANVRAMTAAKTSAAHLAAARGVP